MADGIELGKAYVQIVPSAKGIKDSIVEELGGESARAVSLPDSSSPASWSAPSKRCWVLPPSGR